MTFKGPTSNDAAALDAIERLRRRESRTVAQALVNDLNAATRNALRLCLLDGQKTADLFAALGIFDLRKLTDNERRLNLARAGRTAELFTKGKPKAALKSAGTDRRA